MQLGRSPGTRVANGDEGEQVVSGPAGVVELGSVVRFVGSVKMDTGRPSMGLIKGPAGVRLAASGPAFIDGLGHLVVKADRALGPSLGRGRRSRPGPAGTYGDRSGELFLQLGPAIRRAVAGTPSG